MKVRIYAKPYSEVSDGYYLQAALEGEWHFDRYTASPDNRILLGEFDVSILPPSRADISAAVIAELDAERSKVVEEFTAKLSHIDNRRQKFLALES